LLNNYVVENLERTLISPKKKFKKLINCLNLIIFKSLLMPILMVENKLKKVITAGDLMEIKSTQIETGDMNGSLQMKKVLYMIVKGVRNHSIKQNLELQTNVLKNSNLMSIWIFTRECKVF